MNPIHQPTENAAVTSMADVLNSYAAILDVIIAELQEIRVILEQNHDILTAEKDQNTTYTD